MFRLYFQTSTERLRALLRHLAATTFVDDADGVAYVHQTALELARQGVDLSIQDNFYPRYTLLHYLALQNDNGAYTGTIIALVRQYPVLLHIRNGAGYTPLQLLLQVLSREWEAGEGVVSTALLLIKNGANWSDQMADYPGNTLLHYLVLRNKNRVYQKAILELLALRPAQDPRPLVDIRNREGYTPLQVLLREFLNGQCDNASFQETVLLLASNGANLSVQDNRDYVGTESTIMHALVRRYQKDVCRLVITELVRKEENRWLINIKNQAGQTPLHVLLRYSTGVPEETVKWLVQIGSDITIKDQSDETCLHAACMTGNLAVVKYLVQEKQADLRAKTKTQQTLLHCAASSRQANQDLWSWLIQQGMEIDAQDSLGRTALHLAVYSRNDAMVKWLLEHGADHNMLDHHGDTALAVAKRFAETTRTITVGNRQIARQSFLDSRNPVLRRLQIAAGEREDAPEPAERYDLFGLRGLLEDMRLYGRYLKDWQFSKKGDVVIALANSLDEKINAYFTESSFDGSTTTDIVKFKREFLELLNSKNDEMRRYRVAWKTIIANIMIALTGIGALAIAHRLRSSHNATGRALFFFQRRQTTCEEKIQHINQQCELSCQPLIVRN